MHGLKANQRDRRFKIICAGPGRRLWPGPDQRQRLKIVSGTLVGTNFNAADKDNIRISATARPRDNISNKATAHRKQGASKMRQL